MSMRVIRLPDDLPKIAWVVEDIYQYRPEDPFRLRMESAKELKDAYRNLNMVWGLMRVLRGFSRSLGDMVRGYVWELEREVVGFGAARRVGRSNTWRVSAVGVLPEERGKGIGSMLLQATLDLVLSRGGKVIVADLIEENIPAIKLLQSLGFKAYSGGMELIYPGVEACPAPALPDGYSFDPIGAFDWRPRFAFEKRIVPPEIQRFEPVDEGRFRKPFLARILRPLVQMRGAARDAGYVLRDKASGEIVAEGRVFAKGRSGDHSEIIARWDPQASDVAPFLIQALVHQAQILRPGCPVELSVPNWMSYLAQTALEFGFEERSKLTRYGKLIGME